MLESAMTNHLLVMMSKMALIKALSLVVPDKPDCIEVLSSDDDCTMQAIQDGELMAEGQAFEVMIDVAKRNKNDQLFKALTSMRKEQTNKQRMARSEASMILRKRALEEREEDRKRIQERQKEVRLAANEAEAKKAETARAQQAAHCRWSS